MADMAVSVVSSSEPSHAISRQSRIPTEGTPSLIGFCKFSLPNKKAWEKSRLFAFNFLKSVICSDAKHFFYLRNFNLFPFSILWSQNMFISVPIQSTNELSELITTYICFFQTNLEFFNTLQLMVLWLQMCIETNSEIVFLMHVAPTTTSPRSAF